MKSLLYAGSVVVVLAALSPANAADMPPPLLTKGPPPAPTYTWQGFHFGANGGVTWGRSCWSFVDTVPAGLGGPPAAEGCHDPVGGVVGGQLGYDWQFAGWVAGLEAQGDWVDARAQNVSLPFPTTSNRTHIDALGLFTGRLGYAWGSTLVYAKGGAAVVHNDFDFFGTLFGAPVSGSASATRWGGAVGGGIEYKFTQNWSAAIEYNYIALNRSQLTFATTLGVSSIEDISQNMNLVTARVNYSFP